MDGASIRKQIEGLGPRKRGGRLPQSLRREIADYAQHRRSEGVTVSDIARETGVSEESVRRWSSSQRARRRALVPVRVRADGSTSHGIVIHTAQGHRVTGLDLEGAVRFVRILG
jgi:hypothetical protein